MDLDNIDYGNVNEPEVVKAVVKELKSFGDNVKETHGTLRKAYEELKATVDELGKDALTESKYQKLSEDILTRVQALDDFKAKKEEGEKKAEERLNQIEAALKRRGKSTASVKDSEIDEVREFILSTKSVTRTSDTGVTFEEMDSSPIDEKTYAEYAKAFEKWARKYGGSRERSMLDIDQKALQVGIDPDGGLVVPTAMGNKIIQRVFESDPVRQICSVESITTGAVEWLVDIDEAGYEWEGETNGETTITGETSTPSWRKKKISVFTLAARPRATQTLLEDSGMNIEKWLANKIAAKFSRAEGAAFVSGDGIGKPRGFLSYSNGTTWGTIEQTNMGAAAALTADGFVDVKYALKEQFLERGTWLMNRSTVRDAMKLKTGTGDYIWKPGMLVSDPASSILNLPVRMSTTMPVVAAGALSVALADWREAYMVVDRLGITMQRDPYTVKPFIEFYTRKRVGGDVTNYDAIKIGKISA